MDRIKKLVVVPCEVESSLYSHESGKNKKGNAVKKSSVAPKKMINKSDPKIIQVKPKTWKFVS